MAEAAGQGSSRHGCTHRPCHFVEEVALPARATGFHLGLLDHLDQAGLELGILEGRPEGFLRAVRAETCRAGRPIRSSSDGSCKRQCGRTPAGGEAHVAVESSSPMALKRASNSSSSAIVLVLVSSDSGRQNETEPKARIFGWCYRIGDKSTWRCAPEGRGCAESTGGGDRPSPVARAHPVAAGHKETGRKPSG